MQICISASGNTTLTALGKPFSPSTLRSGEAYSGSSTAQYCRTLAGFGGYSRVFDVRIGFLCAALLAAVLFCDVAMA
jgi:hypothetical protein